MADNDGIGNLGSGKSRPTKKGGHCCTLRESRPEYVSNTHANRVPDIFGTYSIASRDTHLFPVGKPTIHTRVYDSDYMSADVTVFGSIVVRVRSNSAFILFFFFNLINTDLMKSQRNKTLKVVDGFKLCTHF